LDNALASRWIDLSAKNYSANNPFWDRLRASMIFVDNMVALRCSVIIGVFAAVVFVLGMMTTKWEEG